MADYRYSIVKHHGIDCVHVVIDGEELTQTNIPLDNILASAMKAGYTSPLLNEISQIADQALKSAQAGRVVDRMDRLEDALKAIIKLCKGKSK
jgi:hypothetical protein